jgi:polyhydroxyalkanoate synthase subunit PhaC
MPRSRVMLIVNCLRKESLDEHNGGAGPGIEGAMTVGGHAVDLSRIKVSVLHAVAEHDHIVPYESAKHLITMIGSTDKEEVMLKGGHVSLVAGPNAVRRLWPKLDSWLGGRST